MAEVAAGELASSKASDPDVRKFAKMMVMDHGAANQKLANLAESEGVDLPESYSDEHAATLQKLQETDAASFDHAYMAEMVKAHEKTVQMLKSEIASGQDPEVKAFAQGMLPTVESHLREANRVAGSDSAPSSSN